MLKTRRRCGSAAERLLRRLGIRVSDDTILRQLLRAAQVVPPRARIIGIDDWSWRKSQNYGTIIIDLERRAVIDVLEDRDVVTCTDWLRRHPEVEVISRDRCALYAQAARQGAPQAEQVADRFHIVQNLRMAIEEQMNLHGRATGRALLSDADNISTASNLLKSRLAHRKSREEIYKTIWALRQQGLTCSEIGRRTGFPRRSVAKWLQFETPPDRKRAVLKRSSAWYFEEYLKQSWANGIRSGNALFSLIQERGYEGSLSNLQRLLAGWRRAKKQEQGGPIGEPQILGPVRDPETGHAISPVIAAALCIKPRGKLTTEQARKVEALKAGSPAFTTMRRLAMRFKGILRGRKADPSGMGRVAVTSRRTAGHIGAWLEWRGMDIHSLFCPIYQCKAINRGLSTTTVMRAIKTAARDAGLDPDAVGDFSGHSLRVGAAQDLLRAGHDTAAIMRAGGWKSVNVLTRYLEHAEHNVWA